MTVDRLDYLPAAGVTHQHSKDDTTSKSWKNSNVKIRKQKPVRSLLLFSFKKKQKQISVIISSSNQIRLDGHSFTWNNNKRKTGKVDIILFSKCSTKLRFLYTFNQIANSKYPSEKWNWNRQTARIWREPTPPTFTPSASILLHDGKFYTSPFYILLT
jgi:hypothetical protein